MIKSLRLKGFRRYVDETFRLDAGICFVSGRNNAGKTSLFLAVEYALFGSAGGARTPISLMRADAQSMGVELVFVGRDGKTYKLQRLHEKPPRSRTKVVGHFTLKEIIPGVDGAEPTERYLLSSDFQDHEEALARALVEATGMSRRVFELAVHVRQGEIAQILDGDSKLDIALGITAAATANEEMRALALLDERAAEGLPALVASRAHIADEKKAAAADEKGLAQELTKQREVLAAQQARRGSDDAVRALAAQLAEIEEPVEAWLDARDDEVRATRACDDAEKTHGTFDILKERAAALAARRAGPADGATDVADARGDLRGRIRRADAELASGAATCHCCGAPIARATLAPLVKAWRAELDTLDARLADERRAVEEIESDARAIESARLAVMAAHTAVDRARGERLDAEGAVRALVGEGADPAAVLEERRRAHAAAQTAWVAQSAKAEALIEAAEGALADLEARQHAQSERAAKLEREEARLATAVDGLEKRAARALELRALAAAFKTLQEDLRARAATELAEATLRIHRALSVDDELATVRIDPARYQLLVTARDHGTEMPATLAQGGGHRLLLGLAFRLALVERLGPFPFVLLDEPTYGLDEKNRAALLERITGLKLSPQLVLITHQHMGDVAGQHIAIDRAAPAGAA